jgi:ribonucleoside-diphosphate reductase alpha chain
MKISRRFTQPNKDVYSTVEYDRRTSRITNPDGSVVFEMTDAEIPSQWSQLATDIMVSKYFRKAGVPQIDAGTGLPLRDANGKVVTGPEKSVKQVIHRLAGCWRFWAESHGYFDNAEDAQAFYDEIAYMLLHQMCAPNSPQWFNTGLNWAYGITGPAQGHHYCDPKTGQLKQSSDAYSHPQPHACFIQSVSDDLVNPGGIMDLWTREARLFKYGSGTGSNFSKLRGENERLSGGGKSSGLMSFLKIGDRAAGAIKSGGTTRRAAKMVCLDLDHPDIEEFVNWKVREEIKVACLAEGIEHIAKDQQETAKRLGLKLDYDFNGEAYMTVSGQNSNNSVRIPNSFFKAVEEDADWNLNYRTSKKVARTIKARELWNEIAYAAWRCADPGVQFDSTINQWHTCPNSGRINASNPCVTGDTRVLTPGGIWRRIDTMIHLPARIITNLHAQEIHTTEGAFPTSTQEVYELKTQGGYTLKLTADHKVWTKSRGWLKAEDLTTTDEIRLPGQPACVKEVGEPQDPKFFQLLGLFLSDANHDTEALHLDASLPTHEIAEQFSHYIVNHWTDRLYNDDYLRDEPGAQDDDDNNGEVATATLTNRRLLSRLKAFVRFDSAPGMSRVECRLSDEAFTAGLAAQRHLLRALFTADARIDNNTVTLENESVGLLQDIQLLLLGFGVQSSLHLNPEPRTLSTLRGALPTSPDAHPRHGLRIATGSLRSFGKYIALLPGKKLEQLATAISYAIANPQFAPNHDRVASVKHVGREQVFDLTEPATHSFIANGLTVHNCSEYMFLDDTACNLASLNVLTFFDAETRRFDIERYKHAIRLWTIVLEVSVLMASFPSEEIAKLSYKFRTLGLGYANLGAMLMQSGIPYDSDKSRAVCAALTAILTGESYATSAEMAKELGAFPGYMENKSEMLRVMRNHRRAAWGVKGMPNAQCRISNEDKRIPKSAIGDRQSALGDYEQLDIPPVPVDAAQFSDHPLLTQDLLQSARECWDRALILGEQHGYRNAQTTVIAPTGTIGLLMDCDTTGVEPDFALVKFKKLAGGGYFKIANQSLSPALANLGYNSHEIHEILKHVLGTLNLHDSPHINLHSLKQAGFTEDELHRIEESLPAQFELAFAFSPWTIGAATLQRLGIPETEWQSPRFNLLRRLGFSKRQIDEASAIVCGRGTVEGAPHLKLEHYPVFDCANKCGKTGVRFITAAGHIRMMAAAQPFISGAISKTINLPNEATVDEIKDAYHLSWTLGLKANALYRDGSKLSQPLNAKSDEDVDKLTDEDDENNVNAAREEVANDVARAAAAVASSSLSPEPRALNPEQSSHTNIVERIVERVVERPLRRRLPDTRHAVTHKFDVAGHEGYITVGLYEDGSPGEVFITMAKEGSTIGGLMDTIATLVSVSLQYGVPVESLVRKFEHVRFEPSGMTRNPEIPFAKSLVDYIFRWLAFEFVPGYRASNAPARPGKKDLSQNPTAGPSTLEHAQPTHAHHDTPPFSRVPEGRASNGGNGGHSNGGSSDSSSSFIPHPSSFSSSSLRLTLVSDPLSQQGSEMQSDAPACDVCGSITVRSGTCYKCLNCGNSMGCS